MRRMLGSSDYLYLIDPEFGWMHVRIQSWAPYEIQVYVNGREWLARQMDRAGIAYQRSDNKIVAVDDAPAFAARSDKHRAPAVKMLCDKLAHTVLKQRSDRTNKNRMASIP
jgi:hypothetical protein